MMPEKRAVLLDDTIDGDFGDFKAACSVSSPQQQQPEDDDWGDFIVGSQPYLFPNPNVLRDPIPSKSEMPRGALPVSIFGEEEKEMEELALYHADNLFENGFSSSSYSPTPVKVGELKDVITGLYDQATAAFSNGDNFNDVFTLNVVGVKVEGEKSRTISGLDKEVAGGDGGSKAEKDLSAAIDFFGHPTSVLNVMGLASREDQRAYILVWSKLALACAKELQHGAIMWNESLGANVSKQILSRGDRYFAALGEIYRVSEILRASSKLYNPWILSNQDCSRELVTCLESCALAWTASGLRKALVSISTTMYHEVEVLLESIKHIQDLGARLFQNRSSGDDKMICRLSLLPMNKIRDLKVVMWTGDYYCLNLANLWVNRVSRRPPQLPRIHVAWLKNQSDKS